MIAIVALIEGDTPLDKGGPHRLRPLILMGLMNLPLIIVLLLVGISPSSACWQWSTAASAGGNPNASKFIDLPA